MREQIEGAAGVDWRGGGDVPPPYHVRIVFSISVCR